MKIAFTDQSRKDLDGMDNSSYLLFEKHIRKMMTTPPRKHLRNGLPYFVEEVGRGRIVCLVEKNPDTLLIVRCFTTHKEYEKWYGNF